jgi:hypothetical protein
VIFFDTDQSLAAKGALPLLDLIVIITEILLGILEQRQAWQYVSTASESVRLGRGTSARPPAGFPGRDRGSHSAGFLG